MIKKVKRNIGKMLKFGIVGGLGAVVNLVVFSVIVKYFKGNFNFAAVTGFMVAVTQNYLLNHLWTFKTQSEYIKISIKFYIKYVGGSIAGLICNLIILNMFILWFGKTNPMFGQCVGISGGMFVNFIFAKKIVFVSKKMEV